MIGRRPIRSESAPASGETTIGVPKNGRSRRPAAIGEYPRANWNSWVNRNAAANVAPDIRNVVRLPAAKAELRNRRIGTMGSRAFCSQLTNASKSAPPPSNVPRISGSTIRCRSPGPVPTPVRRRHC